MRLIDADTPVKEIRCLKEKANTFGHPDYKLGYISALSCVEGIIASVPTVEAEPVRHGRWIPNVVTYYKAYPPYTYQNGYKCSLCGRVARSKKEPYCHCGARHAEES